MTVSLCLSLSYPHFPHGAFRPRGISRTVDWVNLPASLKVILLKSFREEAEMCNGRWAAYSRSVRGNEWGGGGRWTAACRACSSASLGDTCYHLSGCQYPSTHWGTLWPPPLWHVVFTITGLESIGQLLCHWIQRRETDHQFEDKSRGHHVLLRV